MPATTTRLMGDVGSMAVRGIAAPRLRSSGREGAADDGPLSLARAGGEAHTYAITLCATPAQSCTRLDTRQTKEKVMAIHPAPRPPFPPFTPATAAQKVRLAEDAWNTCDPERVALAYTPESTWRNRSEFLVGREAIVQFLQRKWAKELDYRLVERALGLSGGPHRGALRV